MHRLLFVEEDCINHQALAEALRFEGFQVVCASSHQEAIEQLQVWKASVVLVHSARQAELLELRLGSGCPLLALVPPDLARTVLPADLVLTAPVEFRELVAAIRHLCERQDDAFLHKVSGR